VKLQKAIEILTNAIKNRYLPLCSDLDDATKLGIEALKRVDDQRIGHHQDEINLLHGETKS